MCVKHMIITSSVSLEQVRRDVSFGVCLFCFQLAGWPDQPELVVLSGLGELCPCKCSDNFCLWLACFRVIQGTRYSVYRCPYSKLDRLYLGWILADYYRLSIHAGLLARATLLLDYYTEY